MAEQVSNKPVTIDCSALATRAIGEKLRELDVDSEVVLRGINPGLQGIGSGCDSEFHATISGNAGDYAFMLNQGAEWDVDGNVGHCCGHSMASGRVSIRGAAGSFTGAYIQGGFLAVLGGAGHRCGFRNSGGELLIRSIAGNEAGAQMRSGDLVLANGAGENLGAGMTGGSIYLRGDVLSVAPCIRKQRMKDADNMRLSLLLARAGIKGNVKEFKLYCSREA